LGFLIGIFRRRLADRHRRNAHGPAGHAVISVESRTEAVRALEKAQGDLHACIRTTESEIESVARAFEGLTAQTDIILNLAAAIVGCVENEEVRSVLPDAQSLGAAARRFIDDRLQATSGILEMVTKGVELLRQLSLVARDQAAIALETKALSLLTNIEVGRLGAEGAGFQYLAHELTGFSSSVTKDTLELTNHTEVRRTAIEETKRVLAAELPRQQDEMTRIQVELKNTMAVVDSGLAQLSRTPTQFRICLEAVARQIAGVVAAVQAHDITHQQMEHVAEAFALISARMRAEGAANNDAVQESARAHAGLTIQVYQLRAIKDTVANWTSQLRLCMADILRVSVSEVVAIGPVVLEQERELSSQLAHIETLERESQAYGERIQRTLAGLSELMQLVSEHLQRSKSVRGHLKLLTLNSIIEAGRLGNQAAAILAIAESIKGIAAEWSRITDHSGLTMDEVRNLARQTNEVMEALSQVGSAELSGAQAQTRVSLAKLRNAAAFAARQAQEMDVVTGKMQAKTTQIGKTVDLLDACFGRLDAVLTEIEGVRRRWEVDFPQAKERYDTAEVEKLFSASYTTEIEREILRAALRGAAPPSAQPTFQGNSVELF
jgi:hypothetical protein